MYSPYALKVGTEFSTKQHIYTQRGKHTKKSKISIVKRFYQKERILNEEERKESKSFVINNYDSLPQIPPELWCSPSAILNNDCAVINIALISTTPPIEKAM